MKVTTEADVRALLLDPQTVTVDRSAETLARYRRALPPNEWGALECWAGTLYQYQRAWVFEPARRAIHLGSRQIGKSHESAGTGVVWGAFNGELTTIVSIGQLESAEVLDKAARHARILEKLGSKMARVTAVSKTEMKFASGGRILALPSTGGRSFTGNLFLDELAYQEHATEVWDSAMPTTIRRGLKSRIASTANGVGNLFHGIWTDPEQHQGYATHETTLKTALDAGMSVDLLDCWSAVAKGDHRLFDQIFNCRFLDGEQQYISSEDVFGSQLDNLYVLPGSGVWYAGLDIGKEHDLTVLVIVHFDGSLVRVRAIRSMKRTDHVGLQELVAKAFQDYPIQRLCVDSTGLGAFPTEEMQRTFGRQAVEAVNFGSGNAKELLATTLYSAFSDKWVKTPRTDAALSDVTPGSADGLASDVCSLRRIILPGGGIRYDAPRGASGHADRAWALALALYAVTNSPGPKRISFAGQTHRNGN